MTLLQNQGTTPIFAQTEKDLKDLLPQYIDPESIAVLSKV
jgi:hypothetical protein